MAPTLDDIEFRIRLLAFRLAVLFHHARRPIGAPRIVLSVEPRIRLRVPSRWLAAHPLTAHMLGQEAAEWAALGHRWKE
jgi:exopolyphosphatase/guanosine-5'-triphosphate,3'-diphosphate pyrophosphatase